MEAVPRDIIIATYGLSPKYVKNEVVNQLPEFRIKTINNALELEQENAFYLPEVLLTPESPQFNQIHDINCPQIILTDNYGINDWQPIKNAAYDARDEKINFLFMRLIDSISNIDKKYMSVEENLRLLKEVRELIALKDRVSYKHLYKGSILIHICARILGFSDQEIRMLMDGFLNHDIGKIKSEDKLLNKPSRLTADEFEKIKNHVDSLKEHNNLIFNSDLAFTNDCIEYHHARGNGLGYKENLDHSLYREYIELVTIVDIMEALLAKRPYKNGLPLDLVLDIIKNKEKGLNTEYVDRIYSNLSNSESAKREMVLRLYRSEDDRYPLVA